MAALNKGIEPFAPITPLVISQNQKSLSQMQTAGRLFAKTGRCVQPESRPARSFFVMIPVGRFTLELSQI